MYPVHGQEVDTGTGKCAVPVQRDRRALEDGGQGEGDPPCEDECCEEIDESIEGWSREHPAVEEENRDFDEGEGERVEDLESVHYLVSISRWAMGVDWKRGAYLLVGLHLRRA